MADAQLTSLDDHDLVLQIAKGDARAFEAIYDRYSAQAFGLAMRVTGQRRAAKEATQDAFVGVWRAAGSYDSSRGTVKTWLLSIVRNRSIECVRREARHDRDLEIDQGLVARLEAADRTDEPVADSQQSRHARQLLLGLSTDQRQVIELAFFRGLNLTEIAVKVGAPLEVVKDRQRLALTRMHRKLTGHPDVAL